MSHLAFDVFSVGRSTELLNVFFVHSSLGILSSIGQQTEDDVNILIHKLVYSKACSIKLIKSVTIYVCIVCIF